MAATLEPTKTAQGAKPATGTTASDAIRRAKEAGVQVVDVGFTALPGTCQHFSIPLKELTEELFAEGLGFDGSSIRGFQAINESDMLLMPDPNSAFVDPCLDVPTLSLTCDVVDPVTLERYTRDPRYVAQKAEQYLVKTGIATTAYYGPEAEFYIFNSVRFDQNAHEGYYHVDSEEGIWNSGANGGTPNLGHRPRHKEGYFPVPPVDRLQDLRSKIVLAMMASGIEVEVHHHEVGTAGQTEIDMRFTTLTRMADQLMMYKYLVKNVCHRHGYTVTFMPKPLFGDNGSGMHVHMSLWKDGKNKIEPPEPMDVDLYELEPEERKHVKNTPGSLNETLAALEADHQFLLEGGVFTPDLIETWLTYKRAKEVDPVALRPHPYEFFLYYDV